MMSSRRQYGWKFGAQWIHSPKLDGILSEFNLYLNLNQWFESLLGTPGKLAIRILSVLSERSIATC